MSAFYLIQCIYLTRSTRITSWSWSYGSCIFNYPCNQCLSSLELWVRIPFRWGVLDTTLCDELGTAVSSTNKTDSHDITESHMYILFLPRIGLYVSFLPLPFARGKTSWHKALPVVKIFSWQIILISQRLKKLYIYLYNGFCRGRITSSWWWKRHGAVVYQTILKKYYDLEGKEIK
jgi:hypothetical protein